MTRYAKILLPMAAMIVLGALFLMTGCTDDDPMTPVHLPESGYLAVSPDSLISLWQIALTTMDSTMYGDMYDPAFKFQFSPGDMDGHQLLTDYMTRDETVQTGWNMFSGEDVTNWQGDTGYGVSRISFPFITQDTPWEAIAAGPNTRASARFTLQMFVERGSGYTTLGATGTFDFVAMSRDTTDENGTAVQFYQLLSMVEIGPVKYLSVVHTWGDVSLTYMTNVGPEAALQVTDIGGTPLPLFRCDASGSLDVDSGLHPEPYQWQFETGGDWTDWSENPITTHDYPGIGSKTITVQVRDRWGASGTASQEVNVQPDLPFPDSADKLMENFQTVYESRYSTGYRDLMHPAFLTILQQSTTEEFPDVGTTLDFYEERRIHDRMFSGEAVVDPDGIFVPGVSRIVISNFMALDTWVVTQPDDIIPNAEWAPFEVDFMFVRGQNFSTLKTSGVIKFLRDQPGFPA